MANRITSRKGINPGAGKPCGICGRNICIDYIKPQDWNDPYHKVCLKREEKERKERQKKRSTQ